MDFKPKNGFDTEGVLKPFFMVKNTIFSLTKD